MRADQLATQAQYVYNDKRVQEHFDVKMWVCISRKLDVRRHTREIIESATKDTCPQLDNLDTLQTKLQEILQKSMKFLLVLDDVWFEESGNVIEWQQLLAPLVSQQVGSKILVTSRRHIFPDALFCDEVVHLRNLGDTEFLKLFKHYAFLGADIRDQRLHLALEDVAEKLSQQLGQSPLVARVLSSQLSKKKDISEWNNALKIKDLREPKSSLLWSYEKLDPYLQRCFLFCSLFPKGHRYRVYDLVRLWIAEGLIDLCKKDRRIEDVGMDYFNEMVSCSFFQPHSSGYFYVVHDLLHDLAEELSKDDCFRLEDDEKVTEMPNTVRHLSIHVKSMKRHKQCICKLQYLRTVICIDWLEDETSEIFNEILKYLKRLRVLYLSSYGRKLPECVGELKHLRCLDLSKSDISEFPESLCTLYHLQILLFMSQFAKKLPDKISALTKLLYIGDGWRLPQIPNIGKLSSLQTLSNFSVQKQRGFELRQLGLMKELGGHLSITNLENVTAKDQALELKLHKNTHLVSLELIWSHEDDSHGEYSLQQGVLEALKPPPQLKRFVLDGYKSGTYPSWLLGDSYFEKLETFELLNCINLHGLPPNAELLHHCSELKLCNLPNLKTLPCLPTGLKMFEMNNCPLLMFISSDVTEQHDQMGNIMRAPQLVTGLALIWDSQSWNLSAEHSSLQQLMPLMDTDISEHLQTIKSALGEECEEMVRDAAIEAWVHCNKQRTRLLNASNVRSQLVLPSVLGELTLSSFSITDEALAVCLGGLTLLRRLSLEGIMTLTTLPSEGVFRRLTSLEDLIILSCWCLVSLGGLRAANSLSKLALWSIPSLMLAREAESIPSSIERLRILHSVLAGGDFVSECRTSTTLSIAHLDSLRSLELSDVPDLCTIEGLSSQHLHFLTLSNVPKLSLKCLLKCRVQKQLSVHYSSALLKDMLSIENLTEDLCLNQCMEPSVLIEWPDALTSVRHLTIMNGQMQSLSISFNRHCSLESLKISCCHKLSSLSSDLPASIKNIEIYSCELLKKSCQPNGKSWSKIAHIPCKIIR